MHILGKLSASAKPSKAVICMIMYTITKAAKKVQHTSKHYMIKYLLYVQKSKITLFCIFSLHLSPYMFMDNNMDFSFRYSKID